ncbi:MAG: hypothetical protein ACYYNF_00950 [Actinomycetes bacterium]|jgi:hypothetical protein|nr:hypothetical protein [Candidatus Nanopelagicales bacterium]
MSMGTAILIAAVFVFAVICALYLSVTAGRLDRLHRRIDSSRASLDVQLARRQAVASELAASGLLDPATATVIAAAAHAAREAGDQDTRIAGDPLVNDGRRWLIESDLSGVLAEVFDDSYEVAEVMALPGGHDIVVSLAGITRRVQLTRRFHNDGVRACRQVRAHRFVRWFGLAGRAPWPSTVEMDDTPPTGLIFGPGEGRTLET